MVALRVFHHKINHDDAPALDFKKKKGSKIQREKKKDLGGKRFVKEQHERKGHSSTLY